MLEFSTKLGQFQRDWREFKILPHQLRTKRGKIRGSWSTLHRKIVKIRGEIGKLLKTLKFVASGTITKLQNNYKIIYSSINRRNLQIQFPFSFFRSWAAQKLAFWSWNGSCQKEIEGQLCSYSLAYKIPSWLDTANCNLNVSWRLPVLFRGTNSTFLRLIGKYSKSFREVFCRSASRSESFWLKAWRRSEIFKIW